MATSNNERSYRERVARAVAAIVADPTAEHRLEDLAALTHFSPFHFHRLYRGLIGETVTATIRRVRLAKAAQLLGAGQGSVTSIGMDAGYDSPQAFSRAFAQFTGLAPRDFQRKVGLTMNNDASNQEFAVKLVDRPAVQVQALRHDGPAATIPHTYERLAGFVGAHPTGLWYGIVEGDHEGPAGCAYYAAVSEVGDTLLDPNLKPMTIAGGRYAMYLLKGPYTQINAVLTALCTNWLPQSGFEPDDRACLEVYLNSPHDTAPQDLLTELLLPVRDTN